MPTTPTPGPRHDSDLRPLERPRPEEVHVLFLGLDGLAAALAVVLLRCGVLGLNVNDPDPVSAADLGTGAYGRADLDRPRDASLRRRLRALDARCAPVSAPELFPGALLPGTVVVRSTEQPSPATGSALVRGASEQDTWTGVDPHLPLVALHRTDGVLLRWPTVPWAHRPCPDCLRATLDGRVPAAGPLHGTGVLAQYAVPAHTAAVAAGLAVEVLAVAFESLGAAPGRAEEECGRARIFTPPWPGEVERLDIDRSRCLCGLGQD